MATKKTINKDCAKLDFKMHNGVQLNAYLLTMQNDKPPVKPFTLDWFILANYGKTLGSYLLQVIYNRNFHYMLFDDMKIRYFRGELTIYCNPEKANVAP